MASGKRRDPGGRRWLALCALAFPVIFFAVVATGLYSMLSGRMSLFRPLPQRPARETASPRPYPDRPQAPEPEQGRR